MVRQTATAALIGTILAAGMELACAQIVAPPPNQPLPPAGQGAASPLTPLPDAGATVADPNQIAAQWPMRLQSAQGLITIFQPQLDSFEGDTLTGRSAVSVEAPGQAQPIYGAVWMQSRVSIDRVARTVQILDVNVTRARFPNIDPGTEQALTNDIRQGLVTQPATLSLDQLLAMVQTVQREQQAASSLDNAPPTIVFKEHPTVKVQYDGTPRLVQVPNSPLLRVANTPFFVVLDPASRTYFLKGGGRWFAARDPMGPFGPARGVPMPVAQLADATDYKDPQQPVSNAEAASLEIITATQPTELIWTDGPPQMATLPGTDLLYVTNTDSDMFLMIGTQQVYVLLSGRWYVAPNRNGPWTYVPPDNLPDDFRRIPPASDKGDVLAHVAGTHAADDALADTYVPQTATIDRRQYEQPTVTYDGDPRFEPVQGVSCSYAVNTDSAVVLVRDRYYCCHNAVWYLSPRPVGPWEICTVVPTEVYLLPPTCPIYSVRYVYVYGYTPDVVYVGYTPGYLGCYRYGSAVVYGTGYRYSPWWGRAYYPRPWTFGFAAHYNSYFDQWGFTFGLAAGTGGGRWVGEGPRSWGREGRWFGFGGYRPVVRRDDIHVNVFRNEYLSRARAREGRPAQPPRDNFARNMYERRKDVRRVAAAGPQREAGRPGQRAGEVRSAQGRQPNDVFTDRNGSVYRRTVDGWQVRDGGQWRTSAAPAGARQNPADVRLENRQPARTENPPARQQPQRQPEARPGPQGNSPRQNEPQRPQQPQRAEQPRPQQPQRAQEPQRGQASSRDNSDLNRDYRSRMAGENRLRNYEGRNEGGRAPADRSGPSERPSSPPQRSAPAERPSPPAERPSAPQPSSPQRGDSGRGGGGGGGNDRGGGGGPGGGRGR